MAASNVEVRELARTAAPSREAVRGWWLLVGVLALLWAPLFAACAWLRHDAPWAPFFELAFTEMLVRDVGTAQPPLLGLSGRLAHWPEIGCHPGPLSFYLLAPVYRLVGSSYWALRVSTAFLTGAAILISALIARRRAGAPGVIASGVVLGVLELGFGLVTLTEPWNPYLPVLWFFAFLLALESVFQDDHKLLPAVAVLGSICAQTHIPYLAVCGALGALAAALVIVRGLRPAPNTTRRSAMLVVLVTAALAALLWSPPIIEEWVSERGNITIVSEYLRAPTGERAGAATALRVVSQHLDLWFVAEQGFRTPGLLRMSMMGEPSLARGACAFVLWLACAAAALALRDRALIALHATVAAALGVSLLAASRISGPVWTYLLFWLWSVGALALLSVVATVACVLQRRRPGRLRTSARVVAVAALAVTAVCSVRLVAARQDAGSRDRMASLQVAALAPDVARAIRQGVAGHRGAAGDYLITFDDALYGGGQAFSLLNELERRGLRAYLIPHYGPSVGWHRVIDPATVDARVHIANAGWVEKMRAKPGAREVAHADVRTPAQRREYERLRGRVLEDLQRSAPPEVAASFDLKLGSGEVPGLSPWNRLAIARLHELGAPAAVFVVPEHRSP